MNHIYLYAVPEWFVNFSSGMGILFAIAAGLIAYYSYKVYKLSGQRESELFGMGFALISISYVIRTINSLMLFNEIKEGFRVVSVEKLTQFGLFGIYSYFLIFILGVITIAYATFKVKCKRVYSLIAVLCLVSFFLISDKTLAFYTLSSVILVYICVHYANEYIIQKNGKSALVFLAFLLLLLGGVEPLVINSYFSFVASNLMELGAYVLVTLNLILTFGKKR